MTFWHRATAAVKDRNSLFLAAVSFRRDSDLEAAVIHATDHGSARFDYKYAHLVFSWVRASPVSLHPLIRILSNRMRKTRSWPVALKGLILLHGVLHCGSPYTARIGKLRFDLWDFTDKHPNKNLGFGAFIRNYYAFLAQRCCFAAEQGSETETEDSAAFSVMHRLKILQNLLQLLIQIRPIAGNMNVPLIIEAMDCVVVEIFEIYSEICGGVARLMLKVDTSTKFEASMALQILHRATRQGEELVKYFEFCKDFGVLNAKVKDFPVVTVIPEEDIRELERIINGSEAECGDKAMVVREENRGGGDGNMMKTIITTKWEVFEDSFVDLPDGKREGNWQIVVSKDHNNRVQQLPDLISF